MPNWFDSTTKVFGLGLSKTGTTSLGDALNLLSIKTIHYPFDRQTYSELRSGNYNLTILKEYQAIVDTPVAPFYAQLDKIFPGSKFILTVREIESWLCSIKKHREVMRPRKSRNPDYERFRDYMSAVVYGSLDYNEDRYRFVYEMHVKNVLSYFDKKPEDLLVMNICNGDGWKSLCSFLGVPIPAVPFPHSNQGMSFLANISQELNGAIPAGSVFIMIESNMYEKNIAMDRKRIPFMENEDVYMGLPLDSDVAIAQVEKLIKKYHPGYLVFGWPSFWWFDHYKNFSSYLQARFTCVLSNESVVVFGLHSN